MLGDAKLAKTARNKKRAALCINIQLGQIYKNDSMTLKLQKKPMFGGPNFHVLARYWFPSNGGSSLLVALPRNVMENCLPQGVVSIFLSLVQRIKVANTCAGEVQVDPIVFWNTAAVHWIKQPNK